MGLAFLKDKCISPLVKAFSNTRVVSVHTPKRVGHLLRCGMFDHDVTDLLFLHPRAIRGVARGGRNAGTLQDHQGPRRDVLQRMRPRIRSLLGAANEIGKGAGASRDREDASQPPLQQGRTRGSPQPRIPGSGMERANSLFRRCHFRKCTQLGALKHLILQD